MTYELIAPSADFVSFIGSFEVRQEAVKELEERIMKVPVAVTEALVTYQPNADIYQQKVIDALGETIRMVAPAGSGKTQTIVNRVISEIKRGVNPSRILILTFDNSAASSVKSFLQKHGINIVGLRIMTLNAFGYYLLRQYVKEEYKDIIPDYRRFKIFKDLLDLLGNVSPKHSAILPGNIARSFYLDFFGFLKNELFDPRELAPQQFADFFLKSPQAVPFVIEIENRSDKMKLELVIQAVAWLFQNFEQKMREAKMMDFDDQKLRSYVAMQKDSQLLSAVQSLFSEIVVDEFQDINKLDFEFIRLLSGRSKLIVTGDDDQAIYGFRGCTPEYIINLERHLGRKVSSYELQTNYRCPANIVNHATRLIRNNKIRIEKKPIAWNKNNSNIKIVSSISACLEAKMVRKMIQRLLKENRTLDYQDVAVLYRTNAQSLPLQIEFILNRIPYFVRDADNILQNKVLDKIIGVLRAKQDLTNGRRVRPEDGVNVIKAYFRYFNQKLQPEIEALFSCNSDYLNAISSPEFIKILPKSENSKLVDGVNSLISARSLIDTLQVMSSKFKGLEGMVGSLEDVLQEKVPLGEIFELAANFSGSINDFIKMLEDTLRIARESNAGKNEENGVKLLTYFKSKGLQWHTVFLTTCNDGLIPHSKSPVEDERRLFYVAMTRASSNLFISYVKQSCSNKVNPSQFIREAGLMS